jgi:hypothetical protein
MINRLNSIKLHFWCTQWRTCSLNDALHSPGNLSKFEIYMSDVLFCRWRLLPHAAYHGLTGRECCGQQEVCWPDGVLASARRLSQHRHTDGQSTVLLSPNYVSAAGPTFIQWSVQKISLFYASLKFMIVFKEFRHWTTRISLYCASSIISKLSHPIFTHIFILSSRIP